MRIKLLLPSPCFRSYGYYIHGSLNSNTWHQNISYDLPMVEHMDGSDDRVIGDLTLATGFFSLTTVHRAIVRIINHDKQFTPPCARWVVLFWPLLSIDTLCKEFPVRTLPAAAHMYTHIFLHISTFSGTGGICGQYFIYHDALFPGLNWMELCSSPQRPFTFLCGHFNWATARRGFFFYTRYIHCS